MLFRNFPYKKIANIKLSFSDNCSSLEKEILAMYWELENLEPKNYDNNSTFDKLIAKIQQLYQAGVKYT